MPRSAKAGFTVLEAMIAAAVLAIGIVGVVGLQATLFHSARSSHDMSNASYILQYRSEELGSYSVAALQGPPAICPGAATGCLLPTGGFAPTPACSQNVVDPIPLSQASPGGPYRIDTGIVPHADADHPNAMIATISVCWVDRGGRVRQIQARRVLGDRG
jgi:hypothetical protein